jgi:hypothetical protein
VVASNPIMMKPDDRWIEFTDGMFTKNLKGMLIKTIYPGIMEDEKYYLYYVEEVKK